MKELHLRDISTIEAANAPDKDRPFALQGKYLRMVQRLVKAWRMENGWTSSSIAVR
ncbi:MULTISPECIES: hypothetical protein [Mesorhizobium]|uniref:Transcriptional regulator n=1 Tax=Mesorhizobium robiniae TaxID=559315 RepID=A0ABV2GZD3_9HYPH|nr:MULTISPECIES: hypothetical protein [Mesorhizobium]MCV3242137.1 hypothetical protein [Mesorhizobium sp. ZC-5]